MKKFFKSFFYPLPAIIVGVLAVATIVSAFSTWVDPSGPPSTNNTDTPINVGGLPQTKTGNLYLMGAGVGINTENPDTVSGYKLDVVDGGVKVRGVSGKHILYLIDSSGAVVVDVVNSGEAYLKSAKIGSLNGILKATSGVVGVATAGTDYQSVIAPGTIDQYYRGDKSWQTLQSWATTPAATADLPWSKLTSFPVSATCSTGQYVKTIGSTITCDTPIFGTLTVADIPDLPATKITSGTFGVARGGTGLSTLTTGGILYISATDTFSRIAPTAANQVLRSTGANALAIGSLVAGDIPNLDAGKITTGKFPIAQGGTNATTFTSDELIKANTGGTALESSGKKISDFLSTTNDFGRSGAADDLYEGTISPTKLSAKYLGIADNATTATKLQTARSIFGISFDGTANIGSALGTGAYATIADYAPLNNPTFTGTVSGITATMVGLGNVTNESKTTMFTSPIFTGNVGIGTTPSEKLTIQGSSAGRAVINLNQIGADNWVGLKIDRDSFEKWFMGADEANKYVVRRNGTANDLVIDTSGNITIAQNLTVGGTTTLGAKTYTWPSSGTSGYFLKLGTNNVLSWAPGGGAAAGDAAGQVQYKGSDDLLAGASSLVYDVANGRVGIGTTGPETNLQVAGDLYIGQSTSESDRHLRIYGGAGAGSQYLGLQWGENIAGGEILTSSGDIKFLPGSLTTPTVTFTPSGNVVVIGEISTTGLKITGGNPSAGQFLTALDTSGATAWKDSSQVEQDPKVKSWAKDDASNLPWAKLTGVPNFLTSFTELDPKVGTLTSGKWCTTDGSKVNCASDTPPEADTLEAVTGRGAITSANITTAGLTLNGNAPTVNEGDISAIDKLIGHNDLRLKSDANETQPIYYGASAHHFYTGGTEKMTIATNGDVGISNLSGTETRMVVAGTDGVLSTQSIPVGKTYGGIANQINVDNTTNTIGFAQNPTIPDNLNIRGTAGGITIDPNSRTTTGGVLVQLDGSQFLQIKNGQPNMGWTAQFTDGNRAFGIYTGTVDNDFVSIGAASNHDLRLFAGGGSDKVTIKAGGAVGIGISQFSTGEKFVVADAGDVYLTVKKPGVAGIQMGVEADRIGVIAITSTQTANPDELQFRLGTGTPLVLTSTGLSTGGIMTLNPGGIERAQIYANDTSLILGRPNKDVVFVKDSGVDVVGDIKFTGKLYDSNGEFSDSKWTGTTDIYRENGKVGIGTTDPQGNLDVRDTVAIATGQSDCPPTHPNYLVDVLPVGKSVGDICGASTGFTIKDGNVGIGTTLPSEKLEITKDDVSGNSILDVLKLTRTTSNAPQDGIGSSIAFDYERALDSKSYTEARIGVVGKDVSGNAEKGSLVFSTNNDDIMSEKMRITYDGMVGIGTPGPSNLLTIESNATDQIGIDIKNTSGGTPYRLQSVGSGMTGRVGNFEIWKIGGGNMLTIQPGGNVGIGITGPGAKLEVAGDVKINGGDIIFQRPQQSHAPGYKAVFQSWSAAMTTTHTNPIELTQSGWDTATDNCSTSQDKNNQYPCSPPDSDGKTCTDIYKQGTSPNFSYWSATATCTGNTSKNSIRSEGGTLQFLDAANNVKLRIGQTGDLCFGDQGNDCRSTWIGASLPVGQISQTLRYGGTQGWVISDLIFNNNTSVGIGTITPKGKLDVAGGLSIGSYAGTNNPPSNGMIISDNVGIGTDNPRKKLEIGGNAFITGEAYSAPTTGSGLQVGYNTGTGEGFLEARNYPSSEFKNLVLVGNDIDLRANATSGALIIKSSGNVGIGTTSPSLPLSVQGSVELLRQPGSSVTPGPGPSLYIQSPSSEVTTQFGPIWTSCGESGQGSCGSDDTPDQNLDFAYSCPAGSGGNSYNNDISKLGGVTQRYKNSVSCIAGTSSYSQRVNSGTLEFLNSQGFPKLLINQDGNIGIGSIDSNYKLTVIKGGIKAKGSTSDATKYTLYLENSSLANLMVVRNDGNIGIGTNNPTQKLEINGMILADNLLTYPDRNTSIDSVCVDDRSVLIYQKEGNKGVVYVSGSDRDGNLGTGCSGWGSLGKRFIEWDWTKTKGKASVSTVLGTGTQGCDQLSISSIDQNTTNQTVYSVEGCHGNPGAVSINIGIRLGWDRLVGYDYVR